MSVILSARFRPCGFFFNVFYKTYLDSTPYNTGVELLHTQNCYLGGINKHLKRLDEKSVQYQHAPRRSPDNLVVPGARLRPCLWPCGRAEEQRGLPKQRRCFRVRFVEQFNDVEQNPEDHEEFATPFAKLGDINQSDDESGCLVRQRVGEGHVKHRGKIRPKREVLSLLTLYIQVDERE